MKKILTALLAITLIASGCGKPADQTGNPERNIVDAYSYVYSSEAASLNYLVEATSTTSTVFAHFVDGLVESDKYGIIQPALAESWEVSDDGLVWTFKLREDAKWHTNEGEFVANVTAEDWVSSAKYVLDPANLSDTAWIIEEFIEGAGDYYAALNDGKTADFEEVGIKAIDEYTLEYTLTEVAPWFDSALLYQCFFPAYGPFLEEKGDKFGIQEEDSILYNGEFLFKNWDIDHERAYVKNEEYWDADRVHINTWTESKIADALTIVEMFLNGDISAATVTGANLQKYSDDERVYQVLTGSSTYWAQLNQDSDSENFATAIANENFRKALYYGFHEDTYLGVAYHENQIESIKVKSIMPSGFVTLSNGKDYTEQDVLKDIVGDRYDADKANEHLELAVEELGDTVTFPVDVRWLYSSGSTTAAQQAEAMAMAYDEVFGGSEYIKIVPTQYESNKWIDILKAGSFDIMVSGWGPDYTDPSNFLNILTTDGQSNHIGVNDEEFDRLIEEANAIRDDLDARYEAFAEAEAYYLGKAYMIPIQRNGGNFAMTRIVPFSQLRHPIGLIQYRAKDMQVSDTEYTTEEYNQLRDEYFKAREKAWASH